MAHALFLIFIRYRTPWVSHEYRVVVSFSGRLRHMFARISSEPLLPSDQQIRIILWNTAFATHVMKYSGTHSLDFCTAITSRGTTSPRQNRVALGEVKYWRSFRVFPRNSFSLILRCVVGCVVPTLFTSPRCSDVDTTWPPFGDGFCHISRCERPQSRGDCVPPAGH